MRILHIAVVAQVLLLRMIPCVFLTFQIMNLVHCKAHLAVAFLDDVEALGNLARDQYLLPKLELLADELVDD